MKKVCVFIVFILLACSLFSTTTESPMSYIGLVISFAGLFIIGAIFVYLINKLNRCSGKIRFKVGEKLELKMSTYLIGEYIFKFEIKKIIKNRFTILYEIFSVEDGKLEKSIQKNTVSGSIKNIPRITINIPFSMDISFAYDAGCKALDILIEKNACSYCENDLMYQNEII